MGNFSFSNPLSWSYSKMEILNKCPRRYYYYYYSGFIKDAVSPSPEQWDKYLKVLLFKNLKTVNMWIGTMAHTVISRALISLQNKFADIQKSVESGLITTEGNIRNEISLSSKKSYDKYDKNNKWGLIEHAFRENVNSEDVIMKLRTAVNSFLEYTKTDDLLKSVIEKIPESANQDLKCFIENPDDTDWEIKKTKISGIDADLYLLPDFFIELNKNKFLILDWKTGTPVNDNSEIPEQLKAYSLKLLENVSALDRTNVEFTAYYYFLPSGDKFGGQIDQQTVYEYKEKIISDIEVQKSYLLNRDGKKNIPWAIEKFPLTENLTECHMCCFKIICNRI